MAHVPGEFPRLSSRRPARRSAPSTERYLPPAMPVLRPAPTAEEGLAETLRKLWRHRWLIAATTLILGGTAAVIAQSLPSYYVAEARVLVGVEAPRVFNAEAIITDVSPDAERVANEGFILQSRTLAKTVIDKLHLADDPQFNPELARPSLWSRLANPTAYLPASVTAWLDRRLAASAKAAPAPDKAMSVRDNRLIDIPVASTSRCSAAHTCSASRPMPRSRHGRVDGQHLADTSSTTRSATRSRRWIRSTNSCSGAS